MKKVLALLLSGAFILTGAVWAQTPPAAPAAEPTTNATTPSPAPAPAAVAPAVVKPKPVHYHDLLHRTMHKLRLLKTDLLRSTHDYGGHRAKAVEAIDRAIAELESAVTYNETH